MALLEVKADFLEFNQRLAKIRESGQKLAPVMEVVSEMLVSAVSDRYQSEGDGKWPPHAPATVARMGPHKLMQYTGILSGSTAGEWSEDHAEAFTSVDYIKYHLEGGPKIPKRNPFEIEDQPYDECVAYIQDAVAQLLEGAT